MDFKMSPAGYYVSFPGGFVILRRESKFVLENRLAVLDETGAAERSVHATLRAAEATAEAIVADDPERFARITAETDRIVQEAIDAADFWRATHGISNERDSRGLLRFR